MSHPSNHTPLPRCLVIVSHSQDFMNGVCTNIIHWQKDKLIYYGGNYDTYVKTRSDLEENQVWGTEIFIYIFEICSRTFHLVLQNLLACLC